MGNILVLEGLRAVFNSQYQKYFQLHCRIRRIMGCGSSAFQDNTIHTQTEQEFMFSYRQFISQNRGEVFQFYHLSTVISKTTSSIIRKVIKRSNQQTKICKIIPVQTKKAIFGLSEMQVLKKLNHPNIVQAQQFFMENDFLYIIMEEIPGNLILEGLKARQNIKFKDIVMIMKQLLSAVQYCHKKMIVHRIINPNNIMLIWDTQPVIKLIDFSQTVQKDCPKPFTVLLHKQNFINDLQYICPFQLFKVDIRDCGLIFYYILTGEQPCKGHSFEGQRANYLSKLKQTLKSYDQLNEQLREQLYLLISIMLSKDMSIRPTAEQCLNHQFFQLFEKLQDTTVTPTSQLLKNLLKFQIKDRLKSLICMYFSLNLTSAIEKVEYVNQFYNLDSNKDGEIQYEELVEGFINTFRFDEEKAKFQAQRIFKNLDKDKSGSLDFNEFVMGSMDISKLLSDQTLKIIFKELDQNGDQIIDRAELNSLIFGIEGFNVLNGKKSIDFQEFSQTMNQIAKSKGMQQVP